MNLTIVQCLPRRIGEDVPRVGDEPEGLIGVRKPVPARVEEHGEPAVLSGDELGVVSEANEAEDGVPVGEIGADTRFAGEESVGDGEDKLGGIYEGVIGLACADRVGFGAV